MNTPKLPRPRLSTAMGNAAFTRVELLVTITIVIFSKDVNADPFRRSVSGLMKQ